MWTWGDSPPPPIPSWWWIFITRTGPVCSRRRGSLPPVPTPPRSGLRFGMAQTTVGTGLSLLLWELGGEGGLYGFRSTRRCRPGGVVRVLSLPYPPLSLVSLAESRVPLLDNWTPPSNPGRYFCCIWTEELWGFLLSGNVCSSLLPLFAGEVKPLAPSLYSSCLQSDSFTVEWSFLPP